MDPKYNVWCLYNSIGYTEAWSTKAIEDSGRDWSDASISQGILRIAGSEQSLRRGNKLTHP